MREQGKCTSVDPRPLSRLGISRVFYYHEREGTLASLSEVKELAAQAVRDCLETGGLEFWVDSNENIGTNFMLYRLRPKNEGNRRIRVRIVTRLNRVYQVIVLEGA